MFAASKTASVSGGYQISRSLRFNAPDSAYLGRTPASASNRKTWTWSSWVKRTSFGAAQRFLATSVTSFLFQADNSWLLDSDGTGTAYCYTSAVFSDPSAWYHFVVVFDTTQTTASNRVKFYVNGTQQSLVFVGTIALNFDGSINNTVEHNIGRTPSFPQPFSGYVTEINLIDGQALTPSSFGETNTQTGVWQPKLYTGTYGTNGFYLNFLDNSNTTAATLGKDYSGNGNNWTPNNFSVTAGAGNDSLVDSPTLYGADSGAGGEVRGNYSTWNSNVAKNTYALTYANGNLQVTGAGNNSNGGSGISTIAMTTGKWYSEFVFTSGTLNNEMGFGLVNSLWGIGLSADDYFWKTSYGYQYSVNANKANNNATAAYGATYTTNDVIGVAFDADAGTLTFYKNGTSQGTAYSSIPAGSYHFAIYIYGNTSPVAYANFGQRPFANTAPSGYKALCTQNLPTPTIGATTATQAGKFFNPVLYTGNGSNSRSVTGVGFQPDFVWMKARSQAYVHGLANAVTGVNKFLISNSTGAELTNDAYGYLSSFDSDGFSLTGGTSGNDTFNRNTDSFVAWNWKANGAGSSNTSGSITSTVSANTTAGFSVVTYTGNGSLNATFGHGLGVVPSMIIVKSRSNTNVWPIYHSALGANKYIYLNLLQPPDTVGGLWGSSGPSSSLVYLPTSTSQGEVNGSGTTYVAYCFAEVAGYSKFGSYTGNGSTDGVFVFTGMRPAYIMVKSSSSATQWIVEDTTRSTTNVMDARLFADASEAELSNGNGNIDFLSNGFKLRNSHAGMNGSGSTYIYMAFASAPFKFSLAR